MANVGDIKPHSGGIKIPQAVKDRTRNRILAYTEKHYSGDYTRIDVRFRGQFCYIDAYTEPHDHPDFEASLFSESREEYIERLRNRPLHLCRLRYFGDEDRFSMALYTYRHEKYEPSVFDNERFFGTPEEAFEISAVYLRLSPIISQIFSKLYPCDAFYSLFLINRYFIT